MHPLYMECCRSGLATRGRNSSFPSRTVFKRFVMGNNEIELFLEQMRFWRGTGIGYDDQMNEKDDEITNPGMVSNPKKTVIFGLSDRGIQIFQSKERSVRPCGNGTTS